MIKIQKHVHKLKRHRFKTGNIVYFCAQPDCNYKVAPALALGKKCICWRCGEEFTMSEYSIRLAKPHCDNCHKPKEPVYSSNEGLEIPVIAAKMDSVIPAANDSASSLRTRLSSVLQGKADDEDI